MQRQLEARISKVTMLSMTWQQQPMMGAKSVHGALSRQGPARKIAISNGPNA
jgi:hypothetical protein